jgi:hypothetical protein
MIHAVSTLKRVLLMALVALVYFSVNVANAQIMPLAKASQLVLPANEFTIDFVWKGDTLNTVWEPNAALLIPVKLAGCPKQFYMQFDTGAPQSMLYTSVVNDIKAKYPKSLTLPDSATKLTNQTITIGGNSILAKEILLKNHTSNPVNWKNKKSTDIIGTIGMDFIDSKTIVFNYPAKKLIIGSNVPQNLNSKITLTKFMLVGNSILLPVVIQQNRVMLYFDTGSSAYELLTNKATCLALSTPDAKPVTHQVRSWNTTRTANIYPTKDSVTVANYKLPIKRATYMDGVSNSQVEQMMKMGMAGMTGNKLFINSILVIDTKNKQFGLIPNAAVNQ